MYNPVPIIDRVCTSDYKIPGTEVIIEKGVIVLIPTMGIQKDPSHFNHPEEYIPERFQSGKEDISYLPFGHGPRACIGQYYTYTKIKELLIFPENFQFACLWKRKMKIKFRFSHWFFMFLNSNIDIIFCPSVPTFFKK